MNDKIYFKTRYDGIYESSPNVAFAIQVCISILIYFPAQFALAYLFRSISMNFVIIVGFLLYLTVNVTLMMMLNSSRNMSKSTAFINRDGKLYAIQLLYTNKDLGTETNRTPLYMPAGTLAQAATLSNNAKVAQNVQAHEHEVRQRRNNVVSFSIGLDDILHYIENNPEVYHARCDKELSKADFIFKYNIQNQGMATIVTPNATYNFLILNSPKIVKETKKYFVVTFKNEQNQICTSKFTNCYDHLIEDIKSGIYES